MNNDLISRKALKKEFDEHIKANPNISGIFEVGKFIIDNAPTVEVPENELNCVLTMFGNCSYNETGCSDCEIRNKILKALNERPQGEWIFDSEFTMFGNPYGAYKCSICGCYSPNKYYFCKDCGADMRVRRAVQNEVN